MKTHVDEKGALWEFCCLGLPRFIGSGAHLIIVVKCGSN